MSALERGIIVSQEIKPLVIDPAMAKPTIPVENPVRRAVPDIPDPLRKPERIPTPAPAPAEPVKVPQAPVRVPVPTR